MSSESGNRDHETEPKDGRADRAAAFPLNLPACEDVVELHDDTVREHGGSLGIRDDNALRSALARPQNMLLYGRELDLFDLAASLAHGIMRSHPFQDGNKRASWIAMQITLITNGVDMKVPGDEARDKMFDFANKKIGEDGLAEWLRKKANE